MITSTVITTIMIMTTIMTTGMVTTTTTGRPRLKAAEQPLRWPSGRTAA
jgi:hypothetical protein